MLAKRSLWCAEAVNRLDEMGMHRSHDDQSHRESHIKSGYVGAIIFSDTLKCELSANNMLLFKKLLGI